MDDHGIGGQLICPTKMVIVHTLQDRDDLTKIVQREKVVSQRLGHSFPLFAEPLQDINQPSDRWGWQLIINTQQGRYQARLKPPSRLHQRLEEITCKHTYIKTEPQKGWGMKNTLTLDSHCSLLSIFLTLASETFLQAQRRRTISFISSTNCRRLDW